MSERSLAGALRLFGLFAFVGTLIALGEPHTFDLLLGGAVALAGCSLRIWATGHLEKTRRLVTSGPYAFTRNPLYLGRLLLLIALCLAARLPYGISYVALAAGWSVFFEYYLPRKERVEPARLAALHGPPFERYRAAVPPLFPSLRPWHGAERAGWSAGAFVRNREAYTVALVALVAAILFWNAR